MRKVAQTSTLLWGLQQTMFKQSCPRSVSSFLIMLFSLQQTILIFKVILVTDWHLRYVAINTCRRQACNMCLNILSVLFAVLCLVISIYTFRRNRGVYLQQDAPLHHFSYFFRLFFSLIYCNCMLCSFFSSSAILYSITDVRYTLQSIVPAITVFMLRAYYILQNRLLFVQCNQSCNLTLRPLHYNTLITPLHKSNTINMYQNTQSTERGKFI